MLFRFIKMNSYGNDFLISKNKYLSIPYISKRNLCVGYDQQISFKYICHNKFFCYIINSDGSFSNNCFNGLRCLSKYIFLKISIKKIYLLTRSGFYKFLLLKSGKIISFLSSILYTFDRFFLFDYKRMFFRTINSNVQINFFLMRLYFTYINIGNPHVVFFQSSSNTLLLKKIKCIFFKKNTFINGINISFFDIKEKRVLTHERGSGITSSCGTGTLSSCISYYLIKPVNRIFIFFKTGSLIFYSYLSFNFFSLLGSSIFSYVGFINLNDNRFKK